MSLIKVNDIQTTTGTPNRGKVLQVVNTVKTDTFTTTSGRYVDITGMSASITPSSISSRILIIITLSGCGTNATTNAYARLLRGASVIFAGDASGGRTLAFGNMYGESVYIANTITGCFLDSPATTSLTTYKVQTGNEGNGTIFINRTQSDRDPTDGRTVSSLTLIEVSA